MKKLTLLIIIPMLISGCASIMNGKFQKIIVNTDTNNKVYINGEEAKNVDGKYLFLRDKKPKQITVKRDGYKDENLSIVQYKRSPYHILSFVPFGILLMPMFYDIGNKAWDYETEVVIGKKMIAIPKKDSEAKKIKLNNVSVDINAENIKSRYISKYKQFKKREINFPVIKILDNDAVKIENTLFPELLNEMLIEKGYVDTLNKVLKDSYLSNLYIDAVISGYTVHRVSNIIFPDAGSYVSYGSMVYIDLVIDWQALDYYKKPIYSFQTKSKSGQFSIYDEKTGKNVMLSTLKDAMEIGLIEFMSTQKIDSLLHDKSEQLLEESFKEVMLPKSTSYASTLPQVVKSSVTVKNKNGHGSGFIISNDGYIITNFHVISDTSDLKIIMNDEKEYKVQIIRYSKIYDLALLKIDASNLMPLKISDSKDIVIATEVYAIGTPTAEDLSQTISKGIISGIRKIEGNSKLLQTDASVNGGNSGGALVTKDGIVIGVVSSKLKGFGIEGVAFGIPAYEVYDRLKIKINN